MRQRGWRRFLRLLGTGVLLVVCPLGCGDEKSESAAGDRDAGVDVAAEAAPDGFGASACLACVTASCPVQLQACVATPQCAAYLACIKHCPVNEEGNVDAGCESGCSALDDPESVAAKQGLDTCRRQGAGAACEGCGMEAPDTGASGNPILDQQCSPSSATDSCDKCLMENCCETEAVCGDSPDCQRMRSCFGECSTADSTRKEFHACVHDCYESAPDGAALLARAGACLFAQCVFSDVCDVDLTGCEVCARDECLETFVGCFENPECYLITVCAGACSKGDLPCQQGCIEAYSLEAAAAFDKHATCMLTRCSGCG